MHFIIYAQDKPGAVERRMEVRPRHLEHWGNPPVRIVAGGPMVDEETSNMKGSVLIVEADDMATVRAYAEKDPYWVEGVFESLAIRPMRLLLGDAAKEAV